MEYIVKINTDQDLSECIESSIDDMLKDLVKFSTLEYHPDVTVSIAW